MKRKSLTHLFSIPVFLVAHDWMSDSGKMHAYLMLPPRQKIDLQKGILFGIPSTRYAVLASFPLEGSGVE